MSVSPERNFGFKRFRNFISPESRVLSDKPTNYLALQKAFEEIVGNSKERETGVTFLTDKSDLIVPVFAATGTPMSIPVMPVDYHFDLIEKLPKDDQLNTLVFFHNHPQGNFPKPGFSELDKRFFERLSSCASSLYDDQGDFIDLSGQQIGVYFVVGDLKNQYKWHKASNDFSFLLG